ncbi:MAG: 4Fe-4S binding protein [Ruminococcus sp.]|nr:4Fe-4S binding protein [Ruminococcus sp.]
MSDFLTLKKSNCKNCYKCIRHCPVKSIRFSGNQAHIISSDCIMCGQCVVVCPQNAKKIADGTEKVRVLLQSGKPVIVSLAPSFIANYEGIGINSMRKALKKLGFYDVEETAIGAKMVKTEYERIVNEGKSDVIISSCCHSVNLLIQQYFPDVLPYLAKVVSPMHAHCQDIKKRIPEAHTVFVGPCLSKKDEAYTYGDSVDAVLTFEELTEMLKAGNVTLEKDTEKNEYSLTRLFPTTGGILRTMTDRNSDYTYMTVDGVENCIDALKDIRSGNIHKCFIEMSACSGSCIGGPVMEKHKHNKVRDFVTVSQYAGKYDFEVNQPDITELAKNFPYIQRNTSVPTEYELNEIMKRMGKFRPEQELNCGSCGYNTCREKAVAIYQGKAEVSMCLPFLKEKAESFSDIIVNNTTNGLIVLNDMLEVQQINKSALSIMNLRSANDILGDQIIRILDPCSFIEVQSTGKGIYNERTYLADYQRYVEQTIVLDRNSNMLICIMRDVTDEENERVKKDAISRQTIEIADKVVEKQMRIVQEIASLLGETTAETKIALSKLKESITNE